MSLFWAGELMKFTGHTRFNRKGFGTVDFDEDTPPEMIEEFWKIWPEYHAMVVKLQDAGMATTAYPCVPDVDPNENRIHYGAPLIMKSNQFTALFAGLTTREEIYAKYKSVDQNQLTQYEIDELKTAYSEALATPSRLLYRGKGGETKVDYPEFLKEYNELTKRFLMRTPKPDKNIVLSPYSILTLFLILAEATAGATQDEILRTLYEFSQPHDGFPEHMKTVRDELSRIKKPTFRNPASGPFLTGMFPEESGGLYDTSAICVREDYADSIKPAFVKQIRKIYDNILFFQGDLSLALKNWPETAVNEILPLLHNAMKSNHVLSILNAISFEAAWMNPYDEHQIRKSVFHNVDGTESTVDMLYGGETNYVENEQARGFIKYFQQSDCSFMALLPKHKDPKALSDLISRVNYTELIQNSQFCIVHTVMPEFSFDFEANLKPVCDWLGIRTIFTKDANFSPMSSRMLIADEIMHRAKIEVNRYGVKASAVSYVSLVGSGLPPKIIKHVVLDRPFVFAIMNHKAKVPIFVGVINHL